FQAEDGIRDDLVTGVQTCALPICRRAITAHVMSERELETAVPFIGLQLRFSQRGLAVAALRSDHRLPPMTGSRGRLQLCCFACRRICLIQFSGKKDNSRQITLRYKRMRIEFSRMASLPLSLIQPPR